MIHAQTFEFVIKVKTQFVGKHRWVDAPQEVDFLTNWHRHIFHVEVTLPVDHDNRSTEFFTFQKELNSFLSSNYKNQYFEESCEQIAKAILKQFPDAMYCEVSEDGENTGCCSRKITMI